MAFLQGKPVPKTYDPKAVGRVTACEYIIVSAKTPEYFKGKFVLPGFQKNTVAGHENVYWWPALYGDVFDQDSSTFLANSIAQPVFELMNESYFGKGWVSSPLVYTIKENAVSFDHKCVVNEIKSAWANQPDGVYAVREPAVDKEGGTIFAWGLQTSKQIQDCSPGGLEKSQFTEEIVALGEQGERRGSILQHQYIERVNRKHLPNSSMRINYVTIDLRFLSIACEIFSPLTPDRGSPDDYFIVWYDLSIDFNSAGDAFPGGSCRGSWFDCSDNIVLSFADGRFENGAAGRMLYEAKQPLSLVFVNPLYSEQLRVPSDFMHNIRGHLRCLEKT